MEMSLEILIKRAQGLSVNLFSCWIEMRILAESFQYCCRMHGLGFCFYCSLNHWIVPSQRADSRNQVHLAQRSIIPSEFTRASQGKTVPWPAVYLAFWSYSLFLQEHVGRGWQMKWLSTASRLYLSLSCFTQEIHGDRKISDEGISVGFQNLFFLWFRSILRIGLMLQYLLLNRKSLQRSLTLIFLGMLSSLKWPAWDPFLYI